MSKSKAKGTAFETSLLPLLEQYWPHTERRATEGRNDRGDFAMPGNRLYIVEAKNEKTLKLPEWWRETETEALNAGVPFGLLVHKRRGTTKPEEQWTTLALGQLLKLIHRPQD